MRSATTGEVTPRAPGQDGPPPSGRSRLLRTGAFVLSLGLVVTGALLVPMPLVETAPGGVTDIRPLVDIGGEVTEIDGRLGLLAVRVDQPSIVETLRAALDDRRTLHDRGDVIPAALERRTYVELQQQEFRRSFRVAAAVGLSAAGYEVGIVTFPQVVGVLPDGPSDGRLRIGDVIERFNGTPVASTEDLVRLVRQVSVGDELVLEVRRHDEPIEVVVRAGRVPGLDDAAMGVTLQTREEDIDLPVPVTLADQRGIGGPSAGLMVALTIYDALAEEDLAAGRFIVGTGTLDGDGSVGRIGSVREKALTAVQEGADILLVPSSQADEARMAAAGHVEVIGVETMEQALAALRR